MSGEHQLAKFDIPVTASSWTSCFFIYVGNLVACLHHRRTERCGRVVGNPASYLCVGEGGVISRLGDQLSQLRGSLCYFSPSR
jgi:hypothetical protein